MLFLAEVFPGVPQIQVGEFYYRSREADEGVDPEFNPQLDLDQRIQLHAKNAGFALSYAAASRIVVPTPFQASVIPRVFHPLIRIIHEGIDTDAMRPNPKARITIGRTGQVLTRSTPVVTFINRHFEPVRGFHVFMRALPRLLAALPDVHVLLIGTDSRNGYGPQPARTKLTWKQVMLEELQGRLDLSRVHFPGPLSYGQLSSVLSVSRAHVYLTHPFVLSWSLLDAMACECLVVGSDTAPVRDVIRPGENGLLVPFYDHDALADALIEACRAPQRYEPLRRAARATVVGEFDRRTVCEPAWLALVDEVLGPSSGTSFE
jgi:glycosyltransferase involved in cell wall biosynthesis